MSQQHQYYPPFSPRNIHAERMVLQQLHFLAGNVSLATLLALTPLLRFLELAAPLFVRVNNFYLCAISAAAVTTLLHPPCPMC